jgi:hypothetical protein
VSKFNLYFCQRWCVCHFYFSTKMALLAKRERKFAPQTDNGICFRDWCYKASLGSKFNLIASTPKFLHRNWFRGSKNRKHKKFLWKFLRQEGMKCERILSQLLWSNIAENVLWIPVFLIACRDGWDGKHRRSWSQKLSYQFLKLWYWYW